MLHAILQRARGPRGIAAKHYAVVLPTMYLAAVALPLLLTVVAIGLRLAAVVAARIDRAVAMDAPLAGVTELAPPAPPPAPRIVGAQRIVRPGPLQLVDEAEPSTKHCPDCAESVLASARVCKHCHFRFGPPLAGSYAV